MRSNLDVFAFMNLKETNKSGFGNEIMSNIV